MALQRYTNWSDMGVPVMDEDDSGEWVRLDDVVKLLEDPATIQKWFSDYPKLTYKDFIIALIKGEK